MANGIIQKAAQKTAVSSGNKPRTIRDYVKSMEGEIAKALPSVITPERFTRMVFTALSSNPKLQECTPQSFLGAMMAAAQMGTEVNTALGQAYILPYNNHGTMEATYILGYRGLIDLAYRSGEVKSVQAHEVYENDVFEYEYGLEPKLKHVPAKTNRGNVTHYYAVFTTKDGGFGFEVMSIDDINEFARKFSKSYNSATSPWKTNFDAMAKKGLALDTPIPTPTGWTTMEQLQVGDEVFDMNGAPTKVIAVSEVKHLPCFRVTFSNGGSVVCDDEHRWLVGYGDNARRDIRNNGWQEKTVNEIFDLKASGESVVVPVPEMLEIHRTELPVDPWLLGYWLGDGSSAHASISCNEDWADEVIERIKATTPYTVENVSRDERSKAVQINVKDGFKVALRELGVLENKHVPAASLRSSFMQRIELLQGLMDSDGCIEKERGRARFCSTNKKLRDAVFELATSLGEVCNVHEGVSEGFGKSVTAYWVEWQPAVFCPVTLNHHVEKIKPRQVRPYLSIKSVEKIDSVPTKCIAVESETKTYLCGRGFYVTHNTVLKQVLRYAPLKTEFVRGMTQDGTIHSTISADMTMETSMQIDADGSVSDSVEYVDQDTGEVKPAGGAQAGEVNA